VQTGEIPYDEKPHACSKEAVAYAAAHVLDKSVDVDSSIVTKI